MLKGRFGNTSGRPYLEANLIIPSLQIEGMISFCVDTGADSTVLMPADAAILQVNYSKLTTQSQCVGVGGVSNNYLVPAVLVVSDHDTALYAYHIDLTVLEPRPEMMGAPSLLGRDVLNRWCLTMDHHNAVLTAEIRSFDIRVPLRSA